MRPHGRAVETSGRPESLRVFPKMIRCRHLVLAIPLLAAAVLAQTPVNPVPGTSRGETTLQLGINFGVRFVPASRVTVPVGEWLQVVAPAGGLTPLTGTFQWRKNGQPIPGAIDPILVFASVQASDAGVYDAVYTDPASAGRGSQALNLGVGPVDRLLNLSTRATLNAGPGQSFISGFVVAATNASATKKMVVRAVGPALGNFGVANPLRRPVLRIYDSTGKAYQDGYVYPAVVGGPTYESDLADSLTRCGAFAIPAGTNDVVLMMPFRPGNYSAEVTSGDQAGGMVLLEIYEVP